MSVSNVHTLAIAPGQTSAAVYLRIDNALDRDVVVKHIHTPVAEVVEVHRVIYEEDMMKMRSVDKLRVPRNSHVLFESGSYHLMLLGIKNRWKKGDTFPLTLNFESGLSLSTTVAVH